MNIPSHAMVFGAGLGTRMRPLTDTIPKPLTPLADTTLVDYILDRLAAAGVTDTVVNVHHHADLLEQHLAQRTSPTIHISNERDQLLETGGGLAQALPHFAGQPFVTHNSDAIWLDSDPSYLHTLANAWDPQRMDCLLLLADKTTSVGYSGRGDFVMDINGRLQRRPAETETDLVYSGVSITHPRLLDYPHPDGAFSLNVLWDQAMAAGRVYGVLHSGTWMHVGDLEARQEAAVILQNTSS